MSPTATTGAIQSIASVIKSTVQAATSQIAATTAKTSVAATSSNKSIAPANSIAATSKVSSAVTSIAPTGASTQKSIAATSTRLSTVTSYSNQIAPTTIPATVTSTNAQGKIQTYTTSKIISTTQRVPYTTAVAQAQTNGKTTCTLYGCKWPKLGSLTCCEQKQKGWIAIIVLVVILLIILGVVAFFVMKKRKTKRNGMSREIETEQKAEQSRSMMGVNRESEPYGGYTDMQKTAPSHVTPVRN